MQYRQLGSTGCGISALGFGSMRFPHTEGDEEDVNIDEAVKMLRYAIDNGVNYIDSAYFYHHGRSESIVGEALKDGYRDRTFLATKLPMGKVQCAEDFDSILDEQLARLGTDHIDFYLFHALNNDHWENRVLPFGLLDKMKSAKAAGKIRHIGFSFHDDLWVFQKIIDSFEGWDFCQIQFNYLDCDYQAGIDGLRYAASKGLGVIVMEPLLGGKLADPPGVVKAVLGNKKSPVQRGLDYVWSFPEVTCLLSGMSSMEQVKQNLAFAENSAHNKLNAEECKTLVQAKKAYDELLLVPCTGCRYCMPCSNGVEIPRIFEAWNTVTEGTRRRVKELAPEIEYDAEKCKKCGECEKKCPQQIEIMKTLEMIADKF